MTEIYLATTEKDVVTLHWQLVAFEEQLKVDMHDHSPKPPTGKYVSLNINLTKLRSQIDDIIKLTAKATA
jgi:hypothetical protein